jgi:anti-anti-sigma factor
MSLISSLPFPSLRGPPTRGVCGLPPTIASLDGVHDVSTVATLCDTLAALIASNDADLILDLSAVEFLDASTVAVLLRAEAFLGGRARSLVLRSPSSCARGVLDAWGLSNLVEAGTGRGA